MMRRRTFQGSLVAMVTPFRDGKVDEATLRELVEFHVKSGTDGLVPCGTTGESPTLTHAEHKRVIEIVIEAAAGRIPVIAGTGSNSTAEAIDMTVHAAKAGADGALLVSPYYNKPTQQGLYEHFRTIAEAAPGLPLILYNIQGRTAVNIETDTVARLAEIPNIVGVKEASGSLDQMTAVILACGPDFSVVSGDDSLTLPLMAVGGEGVISVVGNIVPKDMLGLINAMNKGDLAEAQRWHRKLFPLCRDMLSLATNPIPIKAAMKLLGRDPGELRLPMTPLEDAGMTRLKKTLSEYGLL
jgi:4-hydroxy-tetrahydrodipicolinate synthase